MALVVRKLNMPQRNAISRAVTLAILAAVLALASVSASAQTQPASGTEAGPRFRPDGPEADAYGQNEGYPSCTRLAYLSELRCRVGAFSHFDTLFPARAIAASPSPAPLRRAPSEPDIRYSFASENRTLDRYLDANHVTGFLIAQGNSILVERYQYGRTDTHRLTSFSMAKTIIGLLIGIAVQEGAIRSIDDLAEIYVPGLQGSEYGRTPIKALLQMASGVAFREVYSDVNSDIAMLARLVLAPDSSGSLTAVTYFNNRTAPPGAKFSYSSAESLVLGLVLAGATRRTVADYASEKLWGPLGAEADASWIVDARGQELTFAYFNAVLRDWARLGLMLAHDGAWHGRQIIARDWLLAATSIGRDSLHWWPSIPAGVHPPGYGYQVWLLMGNRRTFALRGLRGQFVLVDPDKKLVLVQTALHDGTDPELYALWAALAQQAP
jgi:CubicO group peptidase (beta-lactamase class C family)